MLEIEYTFFFLKSLVHFSPSVHFCPKIRYVVEVVTWMEVDGNAPVIGNVQMLALVCSDTWPEIRGGRQGFCCIHTGGEYCECFSFRKRQGAPFLPKRDFTWPAARFYHLRCSWARGIMSYNVHHWLQFNQKNNTSKTQSSPSKNIQRRYFCFLKF